MTIVIFLRCPVCQDEKFQVIEADRVASYYFAPRCVGLDHSERMKIFEVHRAR